MNNGSTAAIGELLHDYAGRTGWLRRFPNGDVVGRPLQRPNSVGEEMLAARSDGKCSPVMVVEQCKSYTDDFPCPRHRIFRPVNFGFCRTVFSYGLGSAVPAPFPSWLILPDKGFGQSPYYWSKSSLDHKILIIVLTSSYYVSLLHAIVQGFTWL
ncbi:hypothetical protein Cgig2_029517 [Carnegiea gigantea]|uniref:Uncharacterized protein n=1 Tax=Carnegiea gigantea TaxID=171969 RepID=A0A9Q1KKA9_9CARY|nr:hypothetical protein Cgig2_029517 [Carnegiea gigantea]